MESLKKYSKKGDMKYMRKFSFILAILLTITLAVKPVYAVEDLKGDENDYSIELQQYLEELQQFVNEVNCNDAHDENLIDSSLEEYAQKLDTMGYENYIIDNENYDDLYDYLNMDLSRWELIEMESILLCFLMGKVSKMLFRVLVIAQFINIHIMETNIL